MRVLVTGATGFVGYAVVAALAERGHAVTALGRRGNAPPGADRLVRADVRDADAVAAAAAGADAVCHLAALVRVRDSFAEPLEYWRTNLVGTLNVLSALRTRAEPARLVLSSTAAVYGSPRRQPVDEDQPADPRNPYAATKLAADLAAADLAASGAVGAVSLRAFNVAGAAAGRADTELTRLIPKVLAVRAGNAPELVVNGDGSAERDFLHVADLADAFVRALDACVPGRWRAYTVGSGRRTTIRDVLAVAEEVTAGPVPVRFAPAADEPPVLVADPTRARTELGWHPVRSDLPTILGDAWQAVRGG
ncbi:NAD-dependent epimerase/dehydratase family protein [Actinophytocola xanthii]|uniref:UDP-glucose 4-epimerase n=1 Tax=Actinophytocola xanthii TaxID=1912961 RepID=A0A1Q8CPQ0_9PSEU|nr:NAD-dependent epimerase/dehydratase family protein [Actinophytocola xanthii]OLF16326.1 hypothetical protein BU204_17225 [Actinophytocola xanthii]